MTTTTTSCSTTESEPSNEENIPCDLTVSTNISGEQGSQSPPENVELRFVRKPAYASMHRDSYQIAVRMLPASLPTIAHGSNSMDEPRVVRLPRRRSSRGSRGGSFRSGRKSESTTTASEAAETGKLTAEKQKQPNSSTLSIERKPRKWMMMNNHWLNDYRGMIGTLLPSFFPLIRSATTRPCATDEPAAATTARLLRQ